MSSSVQLLDSGVVGIFMRDVKRTLQAAWESLETIKQIVFNRDRRVRGTLGKRTGLDEKYKLINCRAGFQTEKPVEVESFN